MARDRKRAKRRRDRRGTTAGGRVEGAKAVPPSLPVRADLPGSLDHASGEVDEFDAALVRGASGVTAAPEPELEDDQTGPVRPEAGTELAERGTAMGEPPAAPEAAVEETLLVPAPTGGDGDGARGGGGTGGDGGGEGEREQPSAPRARGVGRAAAFLRASWAELQRVQWPDRRQVTQATAVVLGFVAVAGAYLGLADFVAKEIVEFIL